VIKLSKGEHKKGGEEVAKREKPIYPKEQSIQFCSHGGRQREILREKGEELFISRGRKTTKESARHVIRCKKTRGPRRGNHPEGNLEKGVPEKGGGGEKRAIMSCRHYRAKPTW